MSLLLQEISKRFGALQANDRIDLELKPGSLHAVLGENGAGKSTLMKILSGFIAPDSGNISVDGVGVRTGSPSASLQAGIGMLHQEPLVCLPFTVAENFRLGSDLGRTEARARLGELCERTGFDLDPDEVTRTLSIGRRQQLEILRLLDRGVKVLILDEPTSGISAAQRDALFSALRGLAADGLIMLFVSHKLEEINSLCTSVTVMRRGQVVGRGGLPALEDELVRMMFGEMTATLPQRSGMVGKANVASLRGVDAGVGRGSITGADMDVREGEVVGIAGLEGSGQDSLLRVLTGLVPARHGRVEIGGADLTRSSNRRFSEAGVAFLPAGRLEEGLLPGLDLTEHMVLAGSVKGQIIDWHKASEHAGAVIRHFRIKGRPESPVESLSGGNQQRVLLSMLPDRLRLLLMEHPTRGLDLESAAYVWELLLARRKEGTGIVFASSDFDELLAYADRIIVCYDGRIVADLDREDTDAEQIGGLIGGRGAA
jgi:simple sugar transport system ATP-binding protein